jgi:hypothetical protein
MNDCVKVRTRSLGMLRVCLGDSSMRLGVPFIATRQLGAVGDNLGRLILPSAGWRTGQSGVPPDSHYRWSSANLFPFLAQTTVADSRQLAHWTLFGAHRTVRCPCWSLVRATRRSRIARPIVAQLTVGSPDSPVHHQTVRWILAVRRWSFSWERRLHRGRLTGQSDAPPDSPVNYSRTPPSSPESGQFTLDSPGAPDTVRCTTGQSGAPRPSRSWLYIANSFPIPFLLFLALRQHMLVPKTMY